MKKIYVKILQLIIWSLGILIISRIWITPDLPVLSEASIDDRYIEYTPPLHAGDVFAQTFSLPYESLENIAIAFSYEQAPTEDDKLLIEIYQDETLLVEQPLPLLACPNGEYLNLAPGANNFSNSALTLCITNLSESPETSFSLLATTDETRYSAYTQGYEFNGKEQQGSIFCRFRYHTFLTEYNFYQKLTKIFWVLLVTLILSALAGQIPALWLWRTPRSHE